MNPNQTAPTPLSPLEFAIDNLASSNRELHQAIGMLEERVASLLAPAECGEDKPVTPQSATPALAAINEQAECVKCASARIHSLLQRLCS